jgi:predicted DNA binding protein
MGSGKRASGFRPAEEKEPEQKKDVDRARRFGYKDWPQRCRQEEIAQQFFR